MKQYPSLLLFLTSTHFIVTLEAICLLWDSVLYSSPTHNSLQNDDHREDLSELKSLSSLKTCVEDR